METTMGTTKKAMAATFTEVSLEEMETFLRRSFRALRPKQGVDYGEIYYDMPLDNFARIRVWTSIRRGTSTGAGVGADAIRIQLLGTRAPLVKGRAPIVKRTQNWRDNLAERIEEAMEKYEELQQQWAERRRQQQGGGGEGRA